MMQRFYIHTDGERVTLFDNLLREFLCVDTVFSLNKLTFREIADRLDTITYRLGYENCSVHVDVSGVGVHIYEYLLRCNNTEVHQMYNRTLDNALTKAKSPLHNLGVVS